MNIPYIELKPAIYSMSQTVDAIIEKIKAYPEQLMNTREAMKGLTIEFILYDGSDYGQPVGSLSEWVQSHKILLFHVRTRDGDDIIIEASTDIPTKFIIIPEQRRNHGKANKPEESK